MPRRYLKSAAVDVMRWIDMTFHVEKADERSEIIAYLKQNSGK